MSHQQNISRIKGIYNALEELKDEVVFIGGATVSLYANDPVNTDIRPTDDIDILVEIATYGAYTKVQEKLNALGFELDTTSTITCRYLYNGLIIDVMPLYEDVLGFSNRWYPEGFVNKVRYQLDDNTAVNIFAASYFIATKLEAFKGRGNNDGRMSSDFEDIIFVLDNRKEIWEEMQNAGAALVQYLKAEFRSLYENRYLEEWIAAHLEPRSAAVRSRMIMGNIKALLQSAE